MQESPNKEVVQVKPTRKRKMRTSIKIILVVLALAIGITLIPITKLAISAYEVDISVLEKPLPKPLVIMDKDDEVVSELSFSKITSVPLSEMPDILISSIIAVEDKRFYNHWGVDIFGITRSAWENLSKGSIVEGGSTITQQLAKNLFLSSEQTYTRKFTEAIIAFRIEQNYAKDEILELYLNQIYFGEGTWGVKNAAKGYFGKDLQQIGTSEAAMLAALPKAPTHYSPVKNMGRAKERRDLVLNLLYDQGIISQEELNKAINEEIILSKGEENPLGGQFPSYVDYVIDEAIKKHGFKEEEVLTGGLRIKTQMDPVVQRAIEATYERDELFPRSRGEEIVQSGAISIDPSTGGIRGLVGQRGEHVYDGFNRATDLKRQPGSAIKPLAVYAPALEKGYKQSSMLSDEKRSFNGYSPTNINGVYRGRVPMYDALVHSFNLPAVSLLDEIGVQTGIEFMKKAGLPLHENDRNLSIALGGFTEGVSPLDMAQGFSIFANLGKMNEAHAITRIESRTGDLLLEVKEKPVQVMSPQNAYTMTLMLMGVVEEGTGRRAALNRPTAGKTGTTQLPGKGASGARDAWFVGYTPELVTAVWVGYDKNNPNLVMQSAGGQHPANIFKAIMSRALQGVRISSFERPKNYREERRRVMPPPEKEEVEEEVEIDEEQEENEEEIEEREEEKKEKEEEKNKGDKDKENKVEDKNEANKEDKGNEPVKGNEAEED